MIKYYQHKQIGYLLIIALTIGFIFLINMMIIDGFNWVLLLVSIILGVCLISFATLTVVVEEKFLTLRFGPGIIRKKFPLKDIESCRIVKNPWYYSWGIHLTPHGWLYNVSGFYAVEISMSTGKKYRIGTDVPDELDKAIKQSIKKS